MKTFIALMAFVMMSQAYAQTNAAQQVAPAPVQQVAPVQQTAPIVVQAPAAPVEANANVAPAAASPIYIMNNQRLQGYQGTNAVQDAPTTVVQEAPVKISASTTLRKEREGAEAATEDGIVQTLEKARLEDEVRRREKFNAALAPTVVAPVATQQAQQATTSATSVVNAPNAQNVITTTNATTEQSQKEVVVSEPVVEAKPKRKAVVLEDETPREERRDEKIEVRSEVRAAIAETAAPVVNPTQYYVAGQLGIANYSTENIRSKTAEGFSVGMITPDRFVFEGSFMYGKSEIDNIAGYYADYRTYEFNQMNFSAAAKYQLLPGKLRPAVGAIASYTRRSYTRADGGCNCGYGSNDTETDLGSTNSFDAGLEAGLDFAISGNLSIGADLRYLWNIASQNSNESRYRSSSYGGQTSVNQGVPVVEDLSYYIATVAAKFTF